MKRSMIMSLALVAIGFLLWAGYAAQGSYVDENGILQEPFHLLALGWFFVLAGDAAFFVIVVVGLFRKRQNSR